jgi:hypothetical protein
VYKGAHACSKAREQKQAASAHEGARCRGGLTLNGSAAQLGSLGLRRSVCASTRTGVRAQEQPDTHAIRVEEYRGGRRLGSPRRNAGELGFGRATEG